MRKLGLMLAAGLMLSSAAPALAARGSDGDLKILFWQAVSTLNPYLSGGTKELFASSLVLEPLASFDEKGQIVPRLVDSLPTAENGGIAPDLTSVTWKLKPGLKWSDGSALTADDVVFTWQYCTATGGGCAQATKFEGVKLVEALDPLTIKITFKGPKPLSVSGLRRRLEPGHPEGAVQGLSRTEGARLHGRQFRPDRHRAVQGSVVQAQRLHRLRRQRELSRSR